MASGSRIHVEGAKHAVGVENFVGGNPPPEAFAEVRNSAVSLGFSALNFLQSYHYQLPEQTLAECMTLNSLPSLSVRLSVRYS